MAGMAVGQGAREVRSRRAGSECGRVAREEAAWLCVFIGPPWPRLEPVRPLRQGQLTRSGCAAEDTLAQQVPPPKAIAVIS